MTGHKQKNRNLKVTRALQRGISMVELSVVLVVVALISSAVFFGLQSNTRRIEVQDNVSQITEIAAGLKKNFGRANQYSALTTTPATGAALAIRARVIPEQLRVGATAVAQNSYGGTIGIVTEGAAACGTADACATIQWPSVPTAQCMDVVIGVEPGARVVTIDGTSVKALNGQLNLGTLATECDDGTAMHTVNFTVGR